MKGTLKITGALLLAAAVGGVVLQGNALRRVRSENETLLSQRQEIQQLGNQNASLDLLRTENQEREALRRQVAELHKLRNQVRQLREQTKGLPKEQLENQRLRAAAVSQKNAHAAASEAPRPMTLDQVSYFGRDTPEAALQSFLWAVRQGNVEVLRKCLTPEKQHELETQSVEQIRAKMKEMTNRFAQFRIAAKKQVSGDEVQLGLEFYIEGKKQPDEGAIPFKRSAYEWKLDLAP